MSSPPDFTDVGKTPQVLVHMLVDVRFQNLRPIDEIEKNGYYYNIGCPWFTRAIWRAEVQKV